MIDMGATDEIIKVEKSKNICSGKGNMQNIHYVYHHSPLAV